VVLCGLAGSAGHGQTRQYTAPGSLARFAESSVERARRAADEAPWTWGRLRVEPRLTLEDVGYYDNVLAEPDGVEQTSDFRAAFGAGLAAYLRLGSKTLLSGYVAPEYTWWRDLDELRQLNVNSGVALFGDLNRLQLAARATETEQERPLSAEAEIPVVVTETSASLEIEIELRPRLLARASVGATAVRVARGLEDERPDVAFAQLDRDRDTAQAQLVLATRAGLELGLGLRSIDTTFRNDPGGRSNSGTSPLLSLGFTGNKVEIQGTLLLTRLDYRNAELGSFESDTGSVLAAIALGPRGRLALYGARELVFGALTAESTLTDARLGLALDQEIGRRLEASAFVEAGQLDFDDPTGPNAGRRDDLDAFGFGLRLEVGARTALALTFSETAYDSNLSRFDRSATRLSLGFEFKDDLLPW
jgi:hypothetical protein